MKRTLLVGSAVILGVLALAVGLVIVSYLEAPKVREIYLPSFSKVYSAVALPGGELALGGVKLLKNNTYPTGVVALYNLSNGDCAVLSNVSHYFKGGYVYAIGFNGTGLLIGGDERINGTLYTSLVYYNLATHEVVNLSKAFSPFYSIGQVYAIAWTGKYWLVGGNAYEIGFNGQPYLIPFLIELKPNGYVDLSPRLPEEMRVIGGSDTIYTISPYGGASIVAGGNAINMTASIFNGTNFTSVRFPYLHLGVIFTSAWWDGVWIIGGENLTQPNTPEPYLAEVVNYSAVPIPLIYKIGTVTAVEPTPSGLYVALRTPFETSNGIAFGAVILKASNLKSFKTVATLAYVSVEGFVNVGGKTVAFGYKYFNSSGQYEGILLVL